MKDIKGLKHQAVTPFSNFGLIYWIDEEPSMQLFFQSEEEANNTLTEIIEGRGIMVSYPDTLEATRVFPHRVLKIKFLSEYHLAEAYGVKYFKKKNDIALNEKQPTLEPNNEKEL